MALAGIVPYGLHTGCVDTAGVLFTRSFEENEGSSAKRVISCVSQCESGVTYQSNKLFPS